MKYIKLGSNDLASLEYLWEKEPVFVRFTTGWCGWCKAMNPEWDKLREDSWVKDQNLTIVDANASGMGDVPQPLRSRAQGAGIPSMFLLGGSEIRKYSGPRSGVRMAAFLKEHLDHAAGQANKERINTEVAETEVVRTVVTQAPTNSVTQQVTESDGEVAKKRLREQAVRDAAAEHLIQKVKNEVKNQAERSKKAIESVNEEISEIKREKEKLKVSSANADRAAAKAKEATVMITKLATEALERKMEKRAEKDNKKTSETKQFLLKEKRSLEAREKLFAEQLKQKDAVIAKAKNDLTVQIKRLEARKATLVGLEQQMIKRLDNNDQSVMSLRSVVKKLHAELFVEREKNKLCLVRRREHEERTVKEKSDEQRQIAKAARRQQRRHMREKRAELKASMTKQQ